MNVKENFSTNFNKAIIAKGLGEYTNIELGKYLGVSGVTAHNYIKGDKLPSMENSVLFADKLGVSLDWLFLSKGDPEIAKNTFDGDIVLQKETVDPKTQKLINILKSGNISDKAFKDLVISFTDIIQLLCDVEDYTNAHKGERRSEDRPFWKPIEDRLFS